MFGYRQIAWTFAALLTAATVGLFVTSRPASGQTMRPVITDANVPLPPLRPRSQPAVPAQSRSDARDGEPASRVASSAMADDRVVDFDADGDEATTPAGLRRAIRDGDPEPSGVAEQPVDGAPAETIELENPDGRDPVLFDARGSEDSAAFERPPAGFDPELFSAEIAPLADRRTERLFRFEPWQPRGVRIGSFIVYPTVDIGAGYLSNLFRSRPARADAGVDFRPSARLVSNWTSHALELSARGSFSFLDAFPKEGDRDLGLEARGRLDFTRRTNLAGFVLHDVAQESRGTLESRLRGGERADVTTNQAGLTLDHRFNRLAVQLRGTVLTRTFEDAQGLLGGTAVSNRDRDLTATEQAARVRWAFKPTFAVFGETAINQRDFKAATASDGLRRDSKGERYRAGLSFGTTGQTLRGEVSIGYGKQTPLDARLAAIDGVIVDANVAWRMTALTALLLRASTDVTETSTALSAGGFTRRASAEVRHAILRPLIGTASVGYGETVYQRIDLAEHQTDLALGLEYYLGPEAVIFSRWQHSAFRTNSLGGGWEGDEFRVGMRLRR